MIRLAISGIWEGEASVWKLGFEDYGSCNNISLNRLSGFEVALASNVFIVSC
jgi:hypothetical protein